MPGRLHRQRLFVSGVFLPPGNRQHRCSFFFPAVDGRLTKHGAFGVVAEGEAMLSEGIWGEPYAVWLEVTFTPDGAKEKRILASKIYELEGWMR